jgi:hypothetical protein
MLNPLRQAQQETLVYAFFYRIHRMEPLLNFDESLARGTPLSLFRKIQGHQDLIKIIE